MKNNLLLVLLLFLYSFSSAQTYDALQIDRGNQTITIEKIVETNGSKSDLHLIGKSWAVSVLNEIEIRLDDAEAGRIIAKCAVLCPFAPTLTILSGDGYSDGDFIFFTLQIDVKDHKARIAFKDHNLEEMFWSLTGREKTGFKKYKQRVDDLFFELIADFEKAMKDKELINDDWRED